MAAIKITITVIVFLFKDDFFLSLDFSIWSSPDGIKYHHLSYIKYHFNYIMITMPLQVLDYIK